MGFGILFVRKRLDLECPNHFEKCNHKDMMQILIKNSVHEAVLPQQGFILLIEFVYGLFVTMVCPYQNILKHSHITCPPSFCESVQLHFSYAC
jgi:hypothetical protein